MIDVDEQQRARHFVTTPAFQLLAEGAAKAATIGEPRQVIAVGFSAQAIHRLFDVD